VDIMTETNKTDENGKKNHVKGRRLFTTVSIARISIMSALSLIGSFVPFPSPVGTIGFDSLPGFVAAFLFGPSEGSIVLLIGHLVTVSVHGSPLGIMHIPIALGMGLTGWLAGLTRRRYSLLYAVVISILVNTLLFPLAAPVIGWGGALSLVPYLFVVSSLNVVVAAICSKSAESAIILAEREKH
jgi:uncharacterized membrane protein